MKASINKVKREVRKKFKGHFIAVENTKIIARREGETEMCAPIFPQPINNKVAETTDAKTR